jgi:dipeptidase D
MNRCLSTLAKSAKIEIAAIDGGNVRNAIPREARAIIVVLEAQLKSIQKTIDDFKNILKAEYQTTDPQLDLSMTATDLPEKVLPTRFQNKLLWSIYACPNGIYRMSPDIADLVQTSNNLARVSVGEGVYSIQCLTRSSVDSEKGDLQQAITSVWALLGAQVSYGSNYTGWTPNPNALIVKLMRDLYEERYHEKPLVSACHAGLECGILGRNYPKMEMISFGPTIRGAHSPDERVQISSVQKFWGFLLETLVRL